MMHAHAEEIHMAMSGIRTRIQCLCSKHRATTRRLRPP